MAPRPTKFTFYLDENFPQTAGKFFKDLGHAVINGKELLGEGKSDKQHLIAAKKHHAILVAFDRDFRVDADKVQRIRSSPGAILFSVTGSRLSAIQRIINKTLKKTTSNTFSNKLCVVSPEEIKFLNADEN